MKTNSVIMFTRGFIRACPSTSRPPKPSFGYATASFVTGDRSRNTLSTIIRRRSILIRSKRCGRARQPLQRRYGLWSEWAPFGGNLQRPPNETDPHDQRRRGELTLDRSLHRHAIDPAFQKRLAPRDRSDCKFLAPSPEFASYPLEREAWPRNSANPFAACRSSRQPSSKNIASMSRSIRGSGPPRVRDQIFRKHTRLASAEERLHRRANAAGRGRYPSTGRRGASRPAVAV